MRRSSRAWILIPSVILGLVAVGLIVSSLQVECGPMEPEKGQRAAVAALSEALAVCDGDGAEDYATFGQALLLATVTHRNAALTNPADTRVRNLLAKALDCLYALREAWQIEIESTWDFESLGSPLYWNVLHPALSFPEGQALLPEDVRRVAQKEASAFIERAIALAD